jgi:lysophospholipase L1-like esterase
MTTMSATPRPSLLRRRPRLATAGLVLASLMVAAALVEIGLRVAGYRFSPIVFVEPEGTDDHRPFHRGAEHPRVRAGDPLTVPDPDLLWRPNPAVSAELTPDGIRGEAIAAGRGSDHLLILALGDSNTLGPLNTTDHWPGFLDDLLRANTSRTRFQVANAGVYGYTSFQGLRRFRQLKAHRPAVAYFAFGGNDAQPVRTPDERYAARIAAVQGWSRLRLAPPLFHLVWRAADAVAGGPTSPRVPLPDYRANLETFVDEALADGILPVLLTRPFLGRSADPESWLYLAPLYNETVREVAAARGVPFVDAHAVLARRPGEFLDAMHANRLGHRRMAEALLRQLHGFGLVDTGHLRDIGSAVDVSTADERRLELGPGLWMREARPGGGGRWTAAEARLWLAGRRGERWMQVDLSCHHPEGRTRGLIEVNGRAVTPLPRANGRHRLWLDLGAPSGPLVGVRFLVESAYRPRDIEAGSTDPRILGVFLHAVRLLTSAVPDTLDLGAAEDGHPALGTGFFAREDWPDGAGRWTGPEAAFRLTAPAQAEGLRLDLRFQNPRGRTQGTVSVDGRPVGELDEGNGRRTLSFPWKGPAGRTVEVQIQVQTPFRPRGHDPRSHDERLLGVVLHGAWLDAGDGAVRLVREASQHLLEVEFATGAPLTSGRFEVDGEMLHTFRRGPGREKVLLDVSRFGGRVLTVRGIVDFPWGAGSPPDPLVVHGMALRP